MTGRPARPPWPALLPVLLPMLLLALLPMPAAGALAQTSPAQTSLAQTQPAQTPLIQAPAIPARILQPDAPVDLVSEAAVFDGMPATADDAAFPPEIRRATSETAPSPPPWPSYTVRWLALRLSNPAGSGVTDWMLRMDGDPLSLPQVVVLRDGHVVSSSRRDDARAIGPETGAALAVGQRFPIAIPPGESRVVLLRVMSISFAALVADILPRAAWTEWAAGRQVIVIFALALIAAIGIYTLLIGVSLRSSAYLLYVGHSVSLLLFWSNYYGLPADLFGYTDHSRILYKMAGTAATGFAPLMARAMLDTPGFAPWLSRVMLGCGLFVLALLLPPLLLAPWPELQRLWLRGPDWQYMLAPLVHVLILTAAVRALRHSGAVAGFFLAGWSVYIAGTLSALAAFYGLQDFSGIVILFAFLGAGWEALLLALALAARVRRLRHEKATAEVRQRAQQDFLAMISHDLRTPLNAILGATGLIEDSRLPQPVRRRIDTIRRASRILLALISDLLDRAALGSGSLVVARRSVALADCLREAVELVRDRVEERRLHMQLTIDPELPPWIESDDLRLKQILFNLLDSAVGVTASGSIAVTAARGSSSGSDGSRRLLLAVRSGSGLPGFAAGSASPAGSSYGLGLTIAADLARAMGGEIEMETAADGGNAFYLSLPLVPADPVNPPLGGLLLLLVGDAGGTVEPLLRQAGHLVRRCEPETAIGLIGQGGHDAVLLDLDAAAGSGPHLAQRIRALPREDLANLPVIALAGNVDGETRAALAEAGVFDIVLRPVDAAGLQAALARAVDQGPCKVNFALQSRNATVPGTNWGATIGRFRDASAAMLQEMAGAPPQRRAELLQGLARAATAVGLEALAAMASELERRQRLGVSVNGELAGLQALWKVSLERSRG